MREWCQERDLPEVILVSWTLNELIVSFGSHLTYWEYPQLVKHAPIVPPPLELVNGVRSQELSAIEIFNTEDEFLVRVHSALQRFEERFRSMLLGAPRFKDDLRHEQAAEEFPVQRFAA